MVNIPWFKRTTLYINNASHFNRSNCRLVWSSGFHIFGLPVSVFWSCLNFSCFSGHCLESPSPCTPPNFHNDKPFPSLSGYQSFYRKDAEPLYHYFMYSQKQLKRLHIYLTCETIVPGLNPTNKKFRNLDPIFDFLENSRQVH